MGEDKRKSEKEEIGEEEDKRKSSVEKLGREERGEEKAEIRREKKRI